jgi:hypothetical protein
LLRDLNVLRQGAEVVSGPAQKRSALGVDVNGGCCGQLGAAFCAEAADLENQMVPRFVSMKTDSQVLGVVCEILAGEFV